jgi:hypothetical protein
MGFGWIFESLDFWHRKAMTRRSDPPVVLVKWYDFTKWVLGHVDRGVWFLPGTPLFFHHLLRPSRPSKIVLGNLGIENGKLRMENY